MSVFRGDPLPVPMRTTMRTSLALEFARAYLTRNPDARLAVVVASFTVIDRFRETLSASAAARCEFLWQPPVVCAQ